MKKMMIAGLAFLLAACGNKQSQPVSFQKQAKGTQPTGEVDKLSQEYIATRIDSIYKWQNDSLCCTESYLRLDAEAARLSQNRSQVYRDADHWAMGQDVSDDWSYQLQSVQLTTDSTASVKLNIHNFTDQEVWLDMRFERDDWYVDNFRMVYEGSEYDEDGNVIPETEGIKEYNERETIQEFISTK